MAGTRYCRKQTLCKQERRLCIWSGTVYHLYFCNPPKFMDSLVKTSVGPHSLITLGCVWNDKRFSSSKLEVDACLYSARDLQKCWTAPGGKVLWETDPITIMEMGAHKICEWNTISEILLGINEYKRRHINAVFYWLICNLDDALQTKENSSHFPAAPRPSRTLSHML